ncbi:quinone-dependent dihydroorotate dehydrogenase [Mesobaculum littorinae]|uniref:Dihydroorotate dehydrogenase (quinone) n=1 Tax=Mesobaculum littorinae TaxID=2486419 RepID=A0A438AII4_9RHOB|nr:quinone-dependent dihydroorotate dehydrogenase [Mesobaculum littorinae]RVV98448.1 quinone-dependent dihydroorotate dehydrogenase [Mesobaculum littorinae]
MSLRERVGLPVLHRLDPERAHAVALSALRAGLAPQPGPVTSPRLASRLAGLDLPNPVGLAAGFDKGAEAPHRLDRAGFGFLELGGVTPRAQPGNPAPRLWRLPADRAIINRFGFNNPGAQAVAERLARHAGPRRVPWGLNIGANRDSPDRAHDYAEVLRVLGPHVDFATVNVSSPNTAGLRQLQGADELGDLLAGVREANAGLSAPVPIFLKIAPDLDAAQISAIARVALDAGIAGVVATNTTTDRTGLKDPRANETGGLSGAPLFAPSTRVLARLSVETGGTLPLIGVGGVGSAADALAKIRAGASAVQLYSALIWGGLSLAARIAQELDGLLAAEGFATLAEAVGTDRDRWLRD